VYYCLASGSRIIRMVRMNVDIVEHDEQDYAEVETEEVAFI
jgi:hypothetical protein